MMQIALNFFITLNTFKLVNSLTGPDGYKLEQLQVLFRHGDRTPSESEFLLDDPNNEIYEKYGYERLTKAGMEREFKIGQMLRKCYDDFLGEYKYNKVYAYSSNTTRTKMSLQLVLAGLYPPTQSTAWSNFVNWQPIPTHYESINTGFLSGPWSCPAYEKLFRNTFDALRKSKLLRENESYLTYLENRNDTKNFNQHLPLDLYNNFRAAVNLGLPLPHNFTSEDFKKVEEIYSLIYKVVITYTETLRRTIAGPIVERFMKAFNDDESPKKIYLYSGHDFNIAGFIQAHNITGADLPDYGSTLILEKLRGSDDQIYIRIYFWNGMTEKLTLLKVNNCENTCPMSHYKKIVKSILPDQAHRICTYPADLCKR